MTENPYQSSNVELPPGKKMRTSRNLIWASLILLVLAGICLMTTVIGMMRAVDRIPDSTTNNPAPADLASGISQALLPLYAFGLLFIISTVLYIIGIGIRRRECE